MFALGIRDSGERKAGYMIYLYTVKPENKTSKARGISGVPDIFKVVYLACLKYYRNKNVDKYDMSIDMAIRQ